jgi:hypothetical protein
VSGKSNKSRRSRREEAQIEKGSKSQRLVTSAATSLREDVAPYRTASATPSTALRAPSPPPGEKAGMRGLLRFIDLFCGIGGFRYAFERAGCECVFSSDWNKYAQQTYAANFNETPHGDIHSVAVADIPAHDILCAGFPCQPFSIAGVSKKLSLGKAHGFDDKEQGNLFFSLAEIIECHQPAAFVLENVKNLKSHDQGRTFQIIQNTLTDALGYHLTRRSLTRKASCRSTANASFSSASRNGARLNSRNSRRQGRSSNPSLKPMSRTNTR